jgi:membrane associated rhomboid family serine protease
MQVSFVGLAVCAITLIVAYYSRGMLIIGLVASLAFGSTAMMTLTSLGGSSPLIYTLFAALLVMAVTARRRICLDLGNDFGSIRPIWVLSALWPTRSWGLVPFLASLPVRPASSCNPGRDCRWSKPR